MGRKLGATTRRPMPNSQRARAWAAMRNFGQRREGFTVTELRLVTQDELGALQGTRDNLNLYIGRLAKAGYLRCVSPAGPKRDRVWRILRDTGPLPPVMRKHGGLYDPNTGEIHAGSAQALADPLAEGIGS